jgi:hypothetical protein
MGEKDFMIPKLFAIHAFMFVAIAAFLFNADFSSRQPSSEVKIELQDRFLKY